MPRYAPHFIVPQKDSVHLWIIYKNFAAIQNISHIGLGVSAANNARILNKNGYWTEVKPLDKPGDLGRLIETGQSICLSKQQVPISHVVICAAWIPTLELAAVSRQ